MKNVLISMSRRRSLMVPVVTLLAIGIGISGYYIQNQQIVAREEAEKQAQQDNEQQAASVSSSNLSPKETVDESTKVTENGEATEVVDIEFIVENKPENSEVILTAKIDSKEPGICTMYLKQGNYGPEETVPVKDGICEVRFANPGIDTWEAKVLFTSTDGKTRGDAKQDVQL